MNPPYEWRLGVVSYLNARPLIEGIYEGGGFRIEYGVPAELPEWLDTGRVDAALVPVVDLLRRQDRWRIVSDACIGCDGSTLTVRVFSPVSPYRMRRLCADAESHTSVELARVIWEHYYGCPALEVRYGSPPLSPDEGLLLIGDKVVTHAPRHYAYEIDLGGVWKEWTGLPFVFAVWAASRERDVGDLPQRLAAARDRGVARAAEIARTWGPAHGWPPARAEEYLTGYLSYMLTPRHREGMHRFFALAGAGGRGSVVPAAVEGGTAGPARDPEGDT